MNKPQNGMVLIDPNSGKPTVISWSNNLANDTEWQGSWEIIIHNQIPPEMFADNSIGHQRRALSSNTSTNSMKYPKESTTLLSVASHSTLYKPASNGINSNNKQQEEHHISQPTDNNNSSCFTCSIF